MIKSSLAAVFVATAFAQVQAQAQAEQPSSVRFGKGELAVSASLDYLRLFADEFVYNADGSTLSHLLWDTSAAMGVTAEARYGFSDNFSAYGSLTVGLLAENYMEDYDYYDATIGNFDWTHRSRHPDTALDHYFAVDVGARVDVVNRSNAAIGIIGGLRYSDVKWTAFGGDYVYSVTGFRDDIGMFPDGEKGISYQQKLPAIYTGLAASLEHGNWVFDGAAMVGASIGAYSIDHHWIRDLRFIDQYQTGLFLGASAKASYRVNSSMQLKFGVRYDHYARMKATTTTEQISDGSFSGFADGDVAGGAFRALKLSAGINAKF